MSYIGNPPAEAYTNTVKDSFSGDGSTTAFTLSRPSLTNDVRVVVENVIQDPTVAYGVSGTTLTFTSAPPSGTNNIYVVHLGPAVQTTVPPDGVTVTDLNAYGDGAAAFTANRASSDGTIIDLQKDGSAVGSIGTYVGTTYIGSTDGSDAYIRFQSNAVVPCTSAGGGRDNAIDLGQPATRFKNLYLSGGVYLGGTGAANYLDDYEEGTWTISSPSAGYTLSSQTGRYTKIGRLVVVHFKVVFSAVSATNSQVTFSTLPFTSSSDIEFAGSVREQSTTGAIYVTRVASNSSDVTMNSMDGVGSGQQRTIRTSEAYTGTITYFVD